MNSCESYEIHISALLDGEANRADTLTILDHLPGCDACQAFYRDCRELQDVVDARPAGAVVADEPAAIRQLVVPLHRRSRWIWAAAAGIAVFFAAATIGLRPGSRGFDPDARVIDLSTLKPSHPMDDARFMEISIALLQAKPRYQRSMIEILQRFERSRGLDEGSVDVVIGDTELDEPLFGGEGGDERDARPARGTTLQP